MSHIQVENWVGCDIWNHTRVSGLSLVAQRALRVCKRLAANPSELWISMTKLLRKDAFTSHLLCGGEYSARVRQGALCFVQLRLEAQVNKMAAIYIYIYLFIFIFI